MKGKGKIKEKNKKASNKSANKLGHSFEVPDCRLSSLPDDIILHILSFVDTKLAIRTSILSKRWLHLWPFIPAFNISCNSFRNATSLNQFITKFLISHNTSNVHTLILDDLSFLNSNSSLVPQLIRHVVSRQVQHIVLDFSWRVPVYKVVYNLSNCPLDLIAPDCLLASQSLKSFKLIGTYALKISSLNLPSLKTLTLRSVWVDIDNPLFDILLRCPSLESLELNDCSGFCCKSNSFIFSSLKILKLYKINIMRRQEGTNLPCDMFSGLVSLEDLEICRGYLYNPNGFILSCPRLVKLKLLSVMFRLGNKLILSAPRLQYFKFVPDGGVFHDVDFVLENTTTFQVVDIHSRWPKQMSKKWTEEKFPVIVKLFEGLRSVKSLYLTLDTIKGLSLFTDIMLENQTCPLDNLEVLKVRVPSNEVENLQIPIEVMRYLRSGTKKLKDIDVLVE
ncbi:hypothetical protein ACFE04_025075 [Oxalis oulophora]